jgi:hypothetical protein
MGRGGEAYPAAHPGPNGRQVAVATAHQPNRRHRNCRPRADGWGHHGRMFRSFDPGGPGDSLRADQVARMEQMREMRAGPPPNRVPVAWAFTAVVGRSDAAAVAVVLAPLPPDGPLDLVGQWLQFGIGESHTTVHVTGLGAAAAAGIELWPFEADPGEGAYRPPRLGEAGDGFFRPILDPDG